MKFVKNKYTLYIVILLVIVIAGGAVIYSKNTPSHFSSFNSNAVATPMPADFAKVPKPVQNTSSWKTFTDKALKISMKYPTTVMIDPRQTVTGQLYAFIFTSDKDSDIANKVPTLFIADTHSTKLDAFSAFKKSDCGSNCTASPKNSNWVLLNNMYGIKNPLSKDVYNYYLTDKNQSGNVVNVYVGGYTNLDVPIVKKKIDEFDQIIKTIQFNR
jgi:hypothetical protein